MKFCIGIILFLLMPATILVNTSSGIGTPQIFTHTIKVGIANSNFLLGSGWGIGQNAWERALNYSWIVDNQKYVFTMDEFNITLYQYPDALAQFNVIAYAGPHDEQIAFAQENYSITDPNGTTYPLNIRVMKQNLQDYITAGGGWVGHCVGATLPINLSHDYTTWMERDYYNCHFLDPTKCNVSSDTHIGMPILDEYTFFNPWALRAHTGKLDNPEKICQGVFTWYAGCNSSNSSKGGGVPLDVIVTDHNHPIFKDYLNNTWRVQFGGGAGLIIPADADVSRLSSYPSTLDDNSSYVAWRWPIINPPFHRTIAWAKLFLGWIKHRLCNIPFTPYEMEFLINATGWEQHEILGEPQYMDFRVTDMPMTVAFNYPEGDINGGRLVLCSCHPELSIWNTTGNYVAHNNNSSENNLWDGLEVWRNQTTERLLNKSDRIYNTTNWYMRREVAWAAGNLLGEQTRVPDTYLPPVYGNTQVVDITPQLQEHPEFIIKCCFGHNNDETFSPMNLSLFYRYKGANSSYTWTNWTRYASIHTAPYRFTFNATLANGTGRYEFCSILNATRLYHGTQSYYNESFPPAADASCYVGGDIVSDFRFEPGTPYVNETVHFYGEAITKENTYIVTHLWDFGDTRGPGPGPENTTHKFTHPGVYTVNLTVVNNLGKRATALINITALNNPPIADFTPSFIIVHVNDPVDFNDTSTDPDGYLVNWIWDFGDNTTAYTRNATHSYNTSDFYTVSLRVTDNENATDTETKPNCVLAVNAFVNGSLPADIPQQHKWKTIQKAIDNSSTCDFIYVLNGNYTENITVNKSLILIGENTSSVIIEGSVTMVNPHDYELPAPNDEYSIPVISMNGTELIMHFNNDTDVRENYTTSNNVYDYSGQHHNGSQYGATWTTSTLKGAGCFDFDGNDDSINLTSIPALSGVNVTISAWVYWNGGSGDLDPIVSQLNASGDGYCLSVNASTDTPFFQLNSIKALSSATIAQGWHHIVGTHNETQLSIYVDGVLKGTANTTGHGVAAGGFIGFDNASDHFDGRIDEVTIWNRTLSGNEISLDSSSVNEIFSMYNENYGVYMEGFTICDASVVGMLPCNHTEVSRCVLLDNPTGIFIHDGNDVWINQCNITGGTIGINVNSSYPEEYNAIRLVDCDVKNITHAIYVNSSANISVIRTIVNGSVTNLTFNDCDFSSMTIFCATSVYDVAPDVPSISGPENGDRGKTYTYSACTNDSNDDQLLYLFDWDDGNNSGWLGPYWSNDRVNASHAWSNEGGYYVKVKAKDIFNNESTWNSILFRTEMLPPIITSVQHSPNVAGFGATISIQANVTDNQTGNWSGIRTVHVNITLPDHTTENYTITYVGDDIYQYNFSDTWLTGQYNFTIWAQDNAYNDMSSSGYHFHVSVNATITVCTLKNSYSGNEYINLTDPPQGNGGGDDDGNDTQEEPYHYWSPPGNSFGISPMNMVNWSYFWSLFKNHSSWQMEGWNPQLQQWQDSYQGHNLNEYLQVIRVRSTDNASEKVTLNFTSPYTTRYRFTFGIDLRVKNYVNRTGHYEYTLTYPASETENYTVFFNWSDVVPLVQQGKITLSHGIKNMSGLNVFWFMITGNGNLPAGRSFEIDPTFGSEEMYFWSPEQVEPCMGGYYQMDNAEGEADELVTCVLIELGDPYEVVTIQGALYDDELKLLGETDEVEIELDKYGIYDGSVYLPFSDKPLLSADEWYYLVFGYHNFDEPLHTEYYYVPPAYGGSGGVYTDSDIPPPMPEPFAADYVDDGGLMIWCSYTLTGNPPVQSNANPVNGGTGVDVVPLLQVSCSDPDGDTMSATWWTNSSGSWAQFASNSSIANNTVIRQTNGNFNNYSTLYYWRVCLTDGSSWDNETYHFTTGAIETSVDTIAPYTVTSSPHLINATGSSDLNNVSLYYGYSSSNTSDWWGMGWSCRKKITINSSQVAGNFSNFPILVNITDGGLASHAQEDGDDIVFVSYGDNTTRVNHEIETFNGTTGKLCAWVNIPSLRSTGNTMLWMYYGNPSCSSQQNVTGVWSSSFKAVWHLSESPTGTVHDSTGNNNDMTSAGSMTSSDLVNGRVGKAIDFDGSNDYLSASDSASLKPTSVSLLAWYYPRSNCTGRFDIGKMCMDIWGNYDACSYGFVKGSIKPSTNYTGIFERNDNTQTNPTKGIYTLNAWHFLATTHNGTSSAKVYVDGVVGNPPTVGVQALRYNSATNFYIAASHTGVGSGINRWTSCIVDEVWVINGVLNESCIETLYNNQYSPSTFIFCGSEENSSITWMAWNTAGNPDTSYPWSWSFDFPNGTGYYKFYSLGKRSGSADEIIPDTPDAQCHYGNQSKLVNTGSTDIKGYLLMQIQFYNETSGTWVLDNDTVNETSPRTINSGSQLGLDTIFNGKIRASDLTHGAGTYRVYTAFRDPEGNILKTNTGSELEAWWQFSKT